MTSSSAPTVDGGALLILNVLDELTREAYKSKVARSIGSESVRVQLEKLFAKNGRPKCGPTMVGSSSVSISSSG